jgi:[ribosomal protein S5]-alanine N-acetyltransferase
MARMSLPTPTLHTARLLLRPFNDADADALFALHSSAYVLRDWDAPPWSDRVRAEKVHHGLLADGRGRHRDAAGRDPCFRRGAYRLEQSDPVEPDDRSASMGYCLDDAAWGHGYATEAARSLTGTEPSAATATASRQRTIRRHSGRGHEGHQRSR